MNNKLKELLTENFLKWQLEAGETKLQKEFAEDVLEIHAITFSRIFNGKQEATKKMMVLFAEKTGDTRFYDLAELPRPDPDLAKLKAIWKYIPVENRRTLREQGESYVVKDADY